MANCPQSVTFVVPEANPTATYTINFQGTTIENGNSTWCYSVSVAGHPGLSHWNLGVFEECQNLLRENLISVTRNGVKLQEGTGYELGTHDGVSGLKFEVGVEEDESPVLYCITLKGVYEKTSVDVAVKGGPTPAQKIQDAICGPSCKSIKPPTPPTPCQAITDLMESIALQDAGLAHILNAEGEKIQKALSFPDVTIQDLVAINQSVSDVLIKVIKLDMVLEFKLEEINRLNCPSCPPCPASPV
ncbi:MAG: hypothetical protein Q8882_04505 [Bacillota bacterium]|nr:hypothetical protein [Bacillota bacterium]